MRNKFNFIVKLFNFSSSYKDNDFNKKKQKVNFRY